MFWSILEQLTKETLYVLASLASIVGVISGILLMSFWQHNFRAASRLFLLTLIGSILVLYWVMDFLIHHV
ncbi:MAG: hypothetical protein AAB520_04220 [Patescibacteria group bacterium]